MTLCVIFCQSTGQQVDKIFSFYATFLKETLHSRQVKKLMRESFLQLCLVVILCTVDCHWDYVTAKENKRATCGRRDDDLLYVWLLALCVH